MSGQMEEGGIRSFKACISPEVLQDRILKKYQLVKSYKIRIPTRQDWQEPDIIDHSVDHWYTDGSGIQNCFGAGIYGPSYDYRESIPMGSLSTVFFAEVMAILRCVELL
jgi:hypothetical protein